MFGFGIYRVIIISVVIVVNDGIGYLEGYIVRVGLVRFFYRNSYMS